MRSSHEQMKMKNEEKIVARVSTSLFIVQWKVQWTAGGFVVVSGSKPSGPLIFRSISIQYFSGTPARLEKKEERDEIDEWFT